MIYTSGVGPPRENRSPVVNDASDQQKFELVGRERAMPPSLHLLFRECVCEHWCVGVRERERETERQLSLHISPPPLV